MDSRHRNSLVKRAALGLITLAVAIYGSASTAQDWKPDKSVDIIVGAGAGGGNDNTARTIQKLLQNHKYVGVPINVVNKPGGGGAIALTYLQQNASKGTLLGLSSNTLLTNHITKKSPFGPTDFTPLSILINEYMAFNVKVDSPIKNGADLLARLKSDPESIVLGISSALGNINHIAFAIVARKAGIDPKRVKTVVFNSSGASVTALMGGHIDLVVGPTSIAGSRHEAGQLRTLAVTSGARRSGPLAGVPTWKELGIDAVVDNWRGVIGPRGMTAQQIAFWDSTFAQLFKLDEWRKDVEANHWDNAALLSKDSAKYLAGEYDELKRALIALELIK